MQEIYQILNICEAIPLAVFPVAIIFDREKLWASWTRLISSAALLIINALQIPIEIALERNYSITIIILFVWLMNVVFSIFSIKECHKNRKNN